MMHPIFKYIVASITVLLIASSLFGQKTESQRLDGVYEKNVEDEGIISYRHIREADVFWAKRVWREIDIRQKQNQPFGYPKQPFIKILRENVMNERLTAFDPKPRNGDEFVKTMTPKEVSQIGAGTDTIEIYDQYGNYEKDSVVENEFDPNRVKKYRIKEDWFFDENTSTMHVRILGIAPLMQDSERDDVYIPMFWLYYPDIREVLADYEVFNRENDAQRLSWESYLEKRLFDSYITKVNNVHDRRIKDYKNGIDQLLEARNKEEEIFNFEHDLWTY